MMRWLSNEVGAYALLAAEIALQPIAACTSSIEPACLAGARDSRINGGAPNTGQDETSKKSIRCSAKLRVEAKCRATKLAWRR